MPLPPWLETRPDYLANSLATGFQLGQSWRAGQQRAALLKQQIAAKQSQNEMLFKLREDTLKANFQRAQTQMAMTKAYHDAQYGLLQRRVNIEGTKLKKGIQDKAKEVSDTVGYANAVATGMSPLAARAQFPLAKLPATEEKPIKPPPMSDYDKAMHSSLADAYKAAIKTGDILKVGAAAKQLREFDEKVNPQGLVKPSASVGSGSPATTYQTVTGGAVPVTAAPAPAAAPSQKVALANQLAQQHPDWTKQQVIDAVNEQQ